VNCERCSRELDPTENAWRYYNYNSQSSRLISICDECFRKMECTSKTQEEWFDYFLEKRWREPLPCGHCGRPVRIPRRYKLRHVLCGEACRRAVYAIRARLRRALKPRACRICGEEFTPRRSDGLYCSPTCKQSAYRQRHSKKVKIPVSGNTALKPTVLKKPTQ
jgi:hypothetical protein